MRNTALRTIRKFRKNEHGATAIEYGLIAALIAVGMIGGATVIGKKIDATFECTGERIDSVGQSPSDADLKFESCVKSKSR